MLKALFTWLGLSLCTLGYLDATNNPVLAQVTSDGTVNTEVNDDGKTAEITGGETRGDNLFHSFEDFSVKTGNEAFFNNADSIANIFSRVTGGNVSDIDGAIRANGSASLFLINPAGIIFGENASLNIGGSFYGSSASSILFEDGEFSTTDLDNPSLLTVNAPIGLGFRDNPGDIVNRSTTDTVGLQVPSGKTINLIGGDVKFEGGIVSAPGGTIELGGLAEAGSIGTDEKGNFVFPENASRGNLSLASSTGVFVTGAGGGSIFVNARNLDLTSGSRVEAGIAKRLGSPGVQAGNIVINATESIMFHDIGIFNDVGESGVGNGGAIIITSPKLTATNAGILSGTSGKGDSGDISINSNDLILKGVVIDASNFGVIGKGGSVFIKADNLSIVSGAISTYNAFPTSPTADSTPQLGGNISLDVAKQISLSNDSLISTKANGVNNGGNINIKTNFIVAYPVGDNDIIADANQGQGGEININAESLLGIAERPLSGSSTNDITASSEFNLDGTININTSRIDPLQGATELPSNVVEVKQTADQTCSADGGGKANNGLAIAGRGGVHPAPDLPLNSEAIGNENPTQANIPKPLETSQGKIQPARGIMVTKSGKIVLTAYRTNDAGERILDVKVNCGQI